MKKGIYVKEQWQSEEVNRRRVVLMPQLERASVESLEKTSQDDTASSYLPNPPSYLPPARKRVN